MNAEDRTEPSGPSGRRVLVVDDDNALLGALHRALIEGTEHGVTACATFEEAKHRLTHETFEVLLTDIRLGAFNGLQLAVVAKDVNPDIQVIVFSGYDDNVLREEATHIGATYLVKPVTASTLIDLMRR
jgi:two-component system response regulator YesN